MKKIQMTMLLVCSIFWACAAGASEDPAGVFGMIQGGDYSAVQRALHDGFEINGLFEIDGEMVTPLYHAVYWIRPDIVELLLQNGASADIAMKNVEMTPLDCAVLIAAADLDKFWEKWNRGSTLRQDAFKIVDMLICAGSNVNTVNIFGNTPLTHAAGGHDLDSSIRIAQKLIAAGAEVNPKISASAMPPLFWALVLPMGWDDVKEWDRSALVRVLLKAGADPNARLSDGTRPLHASLGDIHSTRFLLDFGANPHAKNNQGKTPIDLAREQGNDKAVKLMVNYKGR